MWSSGRISALRSYWSVALKFTSTLLEKSPHFCICYQEKSLQIARGTLEYKMLLTCTHTQKSPASVCRFSITWRLEMRAINLYCSIDASLEQTPKQSICWAYTFTAFVSNLLAQLERFENNTNSIRNTILNSSAVGFVSY